MALLLFDAIYTFRSLTTFMAPSTYRSDIVLYLLLMSEYSTLNESRGYP